MNSRFSLIALSIAIAVLSLAIVITVVGATASSVNDAVIDIEADALRRDGTGSRWLACQRTNINKDEPLSLTKPISIYLPLLSTAGYVDKAAERAALMALYNSTNGHGWFNNSGWGTDSSYCDWYGVTCDEHEHVTILDLSGNGLTGTLPPEIGNLLMLTILRLPGTIICYGTKPPQYCEYYQLSDPLPPEIGNLQNLQELILDDNKLLTLPPEIGNLVNLHKLNVRNNQLSSLPPELGYLTGLQEIGLLGNQLVSLPAEIGNLVNLPELNLSYNRLTSLPPEIGNLAGLQVLVLDENHLAILPPEIGNLVSLQYLSLINNQLTSLPPEIGKLVHLHELWLLGNQLTCLPPEIGILENLGKLYLSDNQLTFLPSEIGNLASLQILDLHDNQISGIIPAFLSNLGNLWALSLDGNPDLTCWETQEARDWALSLEYYYGPTCYLP